MDIPFPGEQLPKQAGDARIPVSIFTPIVARAAEKVCESSAANLLIAVSEHLL
jgi:hypothetical protein